MEWLWTLVVIFTLAKKIDGCSKKPASYGKCSNHEFYRRLDNGEVSCQIDPETDDRGTCSYHCKKGYELEGYSSLTCHVKIGWNPETKPTCKPVQCQQFSVVNGYHNCQSKDLKYTKHCKIVCKKGFELSNPTVTSVTCTEDRIWSNAIPYCEAMQCSSSFASILNGKAFCKLEYGSECHYSCNKGFKLQGPETVKCVYQKGGVAWEPNEKPSCVVDGCPRDNVVNLANGAIYCVGAEQDDWIGSKCTYSCNLGYYLNGENHTECQASATWSHQKPKCEDRSCGAENLQLLHGRVFCYGSREDKAYNSRCQYECEAGYEISGNKNTMCGSDRRWTNPAPTCKVVECKQPPNVRGGMFNCTSASPAYETECKLTCNVGYKLVGESTITCMVNAAWSDHGYCEEIQCPGKHLSLANGNAQCDTTDRTSYGSVCQYRCNVGYVLNGTDTVTCQLSGEWSEEKPVCQDQFCSEDYITLEDGHVSCHSAKENHRYGSICVYQCTEGYTLSGNNTVQCESDGTWTSDKPICNVKTCTQPKQVPWGEFTCSSALLEYQTTCVLNCSTGYVLTGNDVITCNVHGGWSDSGSCVAVNCSEEYTTLQNGLAKCKGAEKYNSYGSMCSYSCFPGYILNGSQSSTCNSDGFWSEVKPLCEDRQCPKEGIEIKNGQAICQGARHTNGYNSTCFFKCDKGYELTGSPSITCNINKQWSAQSPICIGSKCPNPKEINGGRLVCNDTSYTFETTCELLCNDGYELNGEPQITCMENKDWSLPGRCDDVEPPKFPSGCIDLHVTAEKFGQPTTVIYDLPVATDNSGSDHLIINGNPPPNSVFSIGTTDVNVTATDSAGNVGLCVFSVTVEPASCGEPNIDTTNKQLIKYTCRNNYVYGDTCTLACSDGNPIVGPNVITCTKVDNSDEYKWTAEGNANPTCNPQRCSKIASPKNGMVVCDALGGEAEICSVLCENFYTPPSNYRPIYTCSKSTGNWNPSTKISQCIRAKRILDAKIKPSFYYKNTQCSNDNEEIKAKFLETISNDASLKYLCENGCKITNITVDCYNNTSNRKKRDTHNILFKITPTIHLGPILEFGNASETRDYYQDLENKINERITNKVEDGAFNIPEIGVLDTVDYAEVEFTCNVGESVVVETMSCAGCGVGFFYNNVTQACSVCPHGYYQSLEVAFSCTSCPYQTTTKTEGAVSIEECQDLCNSGESSTTGTKPCTPCPAGTYQPNIGSKRCIRCPFGMTTSSDGQTFAAECYFNNIQLTEESAPVIQIYNSDPKEFTFMTWIYNCSVVFGEAYEDLASIVIDTIPLYLEQPRNSLIAKSRNWNHITLVYDRSNITLYENGRVFERIKANVSLLANSAIRFLQSSAYKEITVHGFQLTTRALTPAEIKKFSNSCGEQVEHHFLSQDPFNKLKLTPATCNDGCGRGYFYHESSRYCRLCDKGYYQDQEKSYECIKCPKGSTGKNTIATSVDFCHELCGSGVVYNISLKSCVKCPKGSYKKTEYMCEFCPEGKTTYQSKSNYLNDCHDYCEPGYFSKTGKLPCEPCPVGTYQTEYKQSSCHFCPYGMSTKGVGSSKRYHCEFYEMLMNSTHGNPIVEFPEENFNTYTLLVRIASNYDTFALSSTSFSLGNSSGADDLANLAVGNLRLNIRPDVTSRLLEEKWLHIALLYDHGNVSLLINGVVTESVEDVPAPIFNKNSVFFTGSNKIKAIRISKMQFSKTIYSTVQIVEFTMYCDTEIKENLLYVASPQISLLAPVKCEKETRTQKPTTPSITMATPSRTTQHTGNSTRSSANIDSSDVNVVITKPVGKRFPLSLMLRYKSTILVDCNDDISIKVIEMKIAKEFMIMGSLNNVQRQLILSSNQFCDNTTKNATIDTAIDVTLRPRDKENTLIPETPELKEIIANIFAQENLGQTLNYEGRLYTQYINLVKYHGQCEDGTGFYLGWCYDCPAGSSSRSGSGCIECSKGYYQAKVAMDSCIPCPEGLTTKKSGSVSEKDCTMINIEETFVSSPTTDSNDLLWIDDPNGELIN